jgi:hypothetical protein
MGRAARSRAAREPAVVRAYVDAAREVLPTVFSADSCLNGTRVCIEALRLHGINARPLVVDMVVTNEAACRMFDEHDGWPTTEEAVQRWMDIGAWVLTVDGKHRDGTTDGWPHHMVACTGDMLIDSALAQASRPHKGIELPWCAAFPRGKFCVTESCIVYDAPHGATIGMRARPDVTDYHEVSGFKRSRHNIEAAIAVANRMSVTLKEEHA